jgi:hypothetical protein
VPDTAWLLQVKKKNVKRVDWWNEARFGMFVHWGVSAVLGGPFQDETPFQLNKFP